MSAVAVTTEGVWVVQGEVSLIGDDNHGDSPVIEGIPHRLDVRNIDFPE